MKNKIKEVLLLRLKFIGIDEQTYSGCPQDLIDEIYNKITEPELSEIDKQVQKKMEEIRKRIKNVDNEKIT